MNIYQKLIEVRKSVTYLKKENAGHQYNYVSSSQALSAIRKKLDEMELLLIPKVLGTNVLTETVEGKDKYGNEKKTTTFFTELNMEYTWVNAENPEEMIVCPWYGQGVDIAGEKGVGKAMTYAEKYFMLKFFNIATDKDDPDAFQEKQEKHEPKKNPLDEAWEGFWKRMDELGITQQDALKLTSAMAKKEIKDLKMIAKSPKAVNDLASRIADMKEAE